MTSGAPPTEQLAFAIHQLYDVFSAYIMPAEVAMSPYRDPEKAVGPMKRMPLRELTASDLDDYAWTALSTVGDEALFKYALPRLLELVTEGEFLTDSEIVLSKLSYGTWHDWPEPEQEAVRCFLMAWWQHTINSATWTLQTNADTVLISIARAESDLTPYLEIWEAVPLGASTQHLASFIVDRWNGETGNLQPNPFLSKDSPAWKQIEGWAIRPETLIRLEAAQHLVLNRNLDDASFDLYEMAIQILRVLLPEESV